MNCGTVAGMFGLVFGLFMLYDAEKKKGELRQFVARAKPAKGIVQDRWVDDESLTMVSIRFTVENDRPVYLFVTGYRRIGEVVDVLYDPDDPDNASLAAAHRRHLTADHIIAYAVPAGVDPRPALFDRRPALWRLTQDRAAIACESPALDRAKSTRSRLFLVPRSRSNPGASAALKKTRRRRPVDHC